MRIVFIRQILPVLCFLGVAAGMTAAEGTGPQANVVAIVNGDVIRRVDLQREVRYLIQDLVHRGREVPGNPEAALGRQALDNLISRLLVYQASQEKGYRVEPYRVEEAVRSYRAGFPDEASYRRTLQRFMYTPESFRQHVERGLIVEKFHDEEIAPTVKITEEEIRRYYEEIRQYFVQVPARVHVRHILIEVPLGVSEADKAAALEKMQGIRERLAQGEDFSGLARQYSQDPGSASRGGDLGFINRDQMSPAFEEAAFRLQPGELSDVVETEYGYHLIEGIARQEERVAPYEIVRATVAEVLERNRINEAVERYVGRLRAAAEIEILLPPEPGTFGEPWSEERTQSATEG